jgi:probable phosphomutase (TIGR03848 family)
LPRRRRGIGRRRASAALARRCRAVYHSAHARPLDRRHGDHAIHKRRRPTTTLILLVRHGRTPTTGTILPGRAPGLHLAEEGRQEAAAAAERIAQLKAVAAVYSSPLERARETAEPIARRRGLGVRIEPGLIECEIGEWTGIELAKAAKLPEWTVVQRHPSGFRFPGGESFMEIQTRMSDTLHALVARHPGETIVAVSHADPLKTAVAHALGTPLDLFQRIVIGTASVSAIAYGRIGPTVLTVNSTGGDLTAFAP